MREMSDISLKFKPPENRTIRNDVKIVLHRTPFIDKTNMLQVPSNINKEVSKVVRKRKETGNKENISDLKNTVRSRTILKKVDDNKLLRELRVNVNNILLNNNVPECTKNNSTGVRRDVASKADYNSSHDPKLNARCVVQLKNFDIGKSSVKSSTMQELQVRINKVYQKNNSTSANKSNETGSETSQSYHQMISSKAINEDGSKITPIISQSTSPKYLRKQAKKNYAEMSLDKSQGVTLPDSASSKKVPIYKTHQTEHMKAKERTDVYEFDEVDSDKVKNRKMKNDVNKSEKFDKSMYNILQKIKMKEAKLQAKNKRKGMGGSRKGKEPVPGIRKKVTRKVSIKEKPENKNREGNIVNTSEHKSEPENEIHIGSVVKYSKNVKSVENIPEHEIQIPNVSNTNVPEDDSSEDSGEFFDYGEIQHSTPVKINPKIKIISNIPLKEIGGSSLFDSLRPNANSTMLPLPNDKKSPWRFHESVKRNPHFITLKRTALPCLQQDMVLDYVQLEKSESNKATGTPKKKLTQEKTTETPNKRLVQKSITDFMNFSPGHIINKENIPHSSLFDYEEFSPKKFKSSRDISKNNAKRNILGPRQAGNIEANDVSTQDRTVPNLTEMNENDNIDTYFGFDDDSDVDLPDSKNRASEARPYRINQIVHKKRAKNAAEPELVVQDVMDLQESLDIQPEADSKEVGLFEDLEQVISLNVPSKIYARKRRRNRMKSVDVDEEENHPKKRNVMTKKEEDEYEKWAARFNSECEEIEKYDLEIE